MQVIDHPVSISLLKGRANYLCLFRFNQALNEPSGLSDRDNKYLHIVRDWSLRTDSGDLAEIDDLPEGEKIHYQVTSTTDNCLGQECEFYDECYVFKARQRAREADLIIVNHHLVFADLALKDTGFGDLLPRVDMLIFDEAHQLPRLASEFFSDILSYRKLKELIHDCRAAYLSDARDMPDFVKSLDALETGLKKFRLALGDEEKRTSWVELVSDRNVTGAKHNLVESLKLTEQILDELSKRSKPLSNCWQRCGYILGQMESYGDRENEQMIQWLEVNKSGFSLYQTPLDISQTFQSRLYEFGCQCIYTSATLAIGKDFSYFASRLGLDGIRNTRFDSPFNYACQTLLYLPGGMSLPNTPEYIDAVIDRIWPVIEITNGNAFLLFTSHQALRKAAALIAKNVDFPVLVQGEAPRTILLKKFRATENAILLGTSSFWEGVDVRGPRLSLVVIDKLPFAPPDDPVFRARAAEMEQAGLNPFIDYQLPEAIINLRQGIGRLIRDIDDHGILVICDPRIKTRAYGKKILSSLPEMKCTSELSALDDFFNQRGKTERSLHEAKG